MRDFTHWAWLSAIAACAGLFALCALTLYDASAGVVSSGGHSPTKQLRTLYSVTNVTTGAFVTLISSTPAQTNLVELTDTSGQTLLIAWAATCALLSTASNAIIIPSRATGDVAFYIPPLACLGIIALSGTASAGELDLTLLN